MQKSDYETKCFRLCWQLNPVLCTTWTYWIMKVMYVHKMKTSKLKKEENGQRYGKQLGKRDIKYIYCWRYGLKCNPNMEKTKLTFEYNKRLNNYCKF